MAEIQMSSDQLLAFELLQSGENVFLTGGAGSGKSFLIREFRKTVGMEEMPMLASTGAAAVLVGGRTFHSFFGLGIMEGGPDATFERALSDPKVLKRIKKVEGIIIDEISMISGEALRVAEALAQRARDSKLPWGGLRVIAVGDFAQLPPVSQGSRRDWCFANPVWEQSGFQVALLRHNQRVKEASFLEVLADVRVGRVTERVREFLETKVVPPDDFDPAPRLLPRRQQAEAYNRLRLDQIDEEEVVIDTIYFGSEKFLDSLRKNAPVPEQLRLKVGCHVMFLQNDPQKRWVNGTRGQVTSIEEDEITVEKENGREVTVEKTTFSLQDADGNVQATCIQFPVNLAYATTIHKSQGATLDELWCDLGALWEPGQAYVALSRLRSGKGLKLMRWHPRSFIVDPRVVEFYGKLCPVTLPQG